MTARAFGVSTPRELLSRAEFEVGELEKLVSSCFVFEEEAKRRVGSVAATCASTLWNIVDWLANSTDAATRAAVASAGLNDYASIRDRVKADSPALTLCWEITNGDKHCELVGYTLKMSQIERASLSASSILRPDQPLAFRFVPKIKTKAGANISALDVYKDALAFWRNFFGGMGL